MSSDSRLRELERKWKESGSTEDEATYLLERVRVGDPLGWHGYHRLSELNEEGAVQYLSSCVERLGLSREGLALAAYAGHEPARRLLHDAPGVPEDLAGWIVGIADYGQDILLHSLVIVARLVLPVWEAERPDDRQPREAVEAITSVLAGRAGPEAAFAAYTQVESRLLAEASVHPDEGFVAAGAAIALIAAFVEHPDLTRIQNLLELAVRATTRNAVRAEVAAGLLTIALSARV